MSDDTDDIMTYDLSSYGAELKVGSNLTFEAVVGEKILAKVHMKIGFQEVSDVKVIPTMKGKGLANVLYNAIEEHTGVKIIPSDNLSYDGYRMWLRRDKDLVKESYYKYRDELLGKKLFIDGKDMVINDIGNQRINVIKQTNKGISYPLIKEQSEEIISNIQEEKTRKKKIKNKM